ncbi:hypothetical protein CHS0354_041770 [Potamilus streckersoni]|uniref:Pyridoxal-dependent decarboxylase domain-containing protein 1 n=1 Tax=Potamilus streckersoni TaxID=2493646 RepID=A0AAE0W653_9BIVA|nr:hypothetical protein CHS0354_041770 [Potamilus streckersoni]
MAEKPPLKKPVIQIPELNNEKPKPTKVVKADMSSEQQFQKLFMDPMFAELERTVKQQEEMLDRINEKFEAERKARIKEQQQAHIPEPLKGSGLGLAEVMKKVEELILYEINEEGQDERETTLQTKKPVKLQKLDDIGHAAITAHSVAAYISTLPEEHLRKFVTKITSDCQLWLAKLFRFDDSSMMFHEEPRDGLVRVCRLALYHKYPKYATEGFEALYSRPPVIYISAASRPDLGSYLCLQLGLPLSCICSAPLDLGAKESNRMDVDLLEKLVQDDIAAAKTPVLLVAYAGTPVVGHVDNLDRLQNLCKKNSIWLHVEGNNLATLAMLAIPSSVSSARSGDSITVTIGKWVGVPALPYATMFKASDPSLVHAAGLNTFNPQLKLNCLPLWIALQSLGLDGILERIQHSCDLAKLLYENLDEIKVIRLISHSKSEEKDGQKQIRSIRELISRALSALLIFEIVTPTVVFRYVEDCKDDADVLSNLECKCNHHCGTENVKSQNMKSTVVAPYAVSSYIEQDEEDKEEENRKLKYYNALNSWLAETLQLENPKLDIQMVEIEKEGVCIRFAPLESAQVLGTTKEDVQKFLSVLKKHLIILNATVTSREKFRMIIEVQNNLRMVEISNWAGLGAVQYIPEHLLDKLDHLAGKGIQDINNLNAELVHQLKSTDLAFSLGHTSDGQVCVKFGLITEDTDVEKLIDLVYSTGKEVEESSKYLESMSDIIKRGIEAVNKDLEQENLNKLYHEGVLRQVPLVSSFINWWSPPPKDTVKGRTFDLSSGMLASTDETYKYRMQVRKDNPTPPLSPSTPNAGASSKAKLKPVNIMTKSAGDVKAGLLNSTQKQESMVRKKPIDEIDIGLEATETVDVKDQKTQIDRDKQSESLQKNGQ